MARRLTTLLVAAGVALLTAGMLAGPAGAISTYNSSPAPERTETGALLVLWDSDSDGVEDSFDWHCTGAMIDRDTFLTASHCIVHWSADPALNHFYVSLDQDVQAELDAAAALGLSGPAEAAYFVAHGQAVEGTGIADPDYGKSQSDPHDIGGHRLRRPRGHPGRPVDLHPGHPAHRRPAVGAELEPAERAVLAGGRVRHRGGAERRRPADPPGRRRPDEGDPRLQLAEPVLGAAVDDQSQGYGGACYGDSGGPNFVTLNGTMLLAGSPSPATRRATPPTSPTGPTTASARSFLAPYVQLP